MRRITISKVCMLTCLCIAASSPATANVDIVWQPSTLYAEPGEIVELGVYAVASGGINEPFTVADLVLSWDPVRLRFLGVIDTGPYQWLLAGFLDDTNLDGWNNSLEDGDAWYTAWTNFTEYPVATPQGLLIGVFQFEVVAAAPTATIDLLVEDGIFAFTAIYDEEIGGRIITGQVGNAMVQTSAPEATGDVDGDGDVDLDDAGSLLNTCFAGPDIFSGEGCEMTDFNYDGDVDLGDFATFQNLFSGS